MTATIPVRLEESFRSPTGWDLDVELYDGTLATYTLIPSRRIAGAWSVWSANDAGWSRIEDVRRAGILTAENGGPATYGHTDYYACDGIAEVIRQRSEPATR